jgi:RNA polymerase sigma factor (sigma-70 family)
MYKRVTLKRHSFFMKFFIPKVTALQERIIIEALKTNSKKGIELLYKWYAASLRLLILSIIRDEHNTEDLLQETILKIHHHIHYYNKDKGKFTTWILRIARNHCFDYKRSKKYKNEQSTFSIQLLSENDHQYADNYISLHHELIDLRKALSLLPVDLRIYIIENYFNGLKHHEIADKYNLPLGTVKSKILKGMRLLKKIMKT